MRKHFKILFLAFAVLFYHQICAQGLVKDYTFSSTVGTYTPITGGVDVNSIEDDDELSAALPIGFNFKYDGISYSQLKASSNGFIVLDISKTSSRLINDLDRVNEPIIAPLWDDLEGDAIGTEARYQTTGTMPNRVFTFEWYKWEWRHTANDSTISFQVKLYEGSNKIEFIYLPHLQPNGPSASIGLCGLGTRAGTFLSLNETGSNPLVSSTTEYTNLKGNPDPGRTYTFTPPTCEPISFVRDTSHQENSVTLLFETGTPAATPFQLEYGPRGFQLGQGTQVLGNSSAGTSSQVINGLTKATEYTVYVRNICSTGDTSSWVNHNFSTAYHNPQFVDMVGFSGGNLGSTFPGWREANSWPVPTSNSSAWDDATSSQISHFGKRTARVYLYGRTRDEWLISPNVVIKSGDSLTFEVALTDNGNASPDNMGADDSVKVLISENNGTTWDTLKVFTRANQPTTQLSRHAFSLNAYAGKAIKVGIYAQDGPVDNSETYNFHVTDIFIGSPPQTDMLAQESYTSTGCIGANTPVYAVIQNNSASTVHFNQKNTTVGVKVSGKSSGTLSTTLTSDSLSAGDTMHIMVGAYNYTYKGTYSMFSYVGIAQDENNTNDSSSSRNIVQDSIHVPNEKVDFDGFTGSNLRNRFLDWREATGVVPAGTSSRWDDANSAQETYYGQTTAVLNLYTTSRREWMISPKISIRANDSLFFDAALSDDGFARTDHMGSDDSVKVMISTDCGQSWQSLMIFTRANEPGLPLSTYKIPLGSYAGSTAMIGFYGQDGPINDLEDYDFHITNIFIGLPPTVDLIAEEVYAEQGCLSANHNLKAVIRNGATSDIQFANFPSTVGVKVAGANNGTISTTVNTGTLPAGDTMHVSVGAFNFSANGTYQMRSFVGLLQDEQLKNDTSSQSSVEQDSTYPSPQLVDFAGFSGSNLSSAFSGWREGSGVNGTGTSSRWDDASSSQKTHFGQNTAKVNLFTTSRREWIIGPKVDIQSSDTLFFDAAVTNYNSGGSDNMGSDDTVKVLLSIDCGNSWINLMNFTRTTNLSNQLTNYSVPLSSYAGNKGIIAFYAQDGPINDIEDYDFHLTNINLGTRKKVDLGVTEMLNLNSSLCGSAATPIEVVVENFGITTQTNVTVNVALTGGINTSINATIATLTPGQIDTITVGTVNTLAGGLVDIVAYTAQTGEEELANDSIWVRSLKLFNLPSPPSTKDDSACVESNSVLVAKGTGQIMWYNKKQPNILIQEGDSLFLNGILQNDTFEVEIINPTTEIVTGPAAPLDGYMDSDKGRGLGFEVFDPEVIIDSVTVYPSGSGWFFVNVSDNAGNPIYSSTDTSFISNATGTALRIPVGITVPKGKYKMTLTYKGISDMGRTNNGLQYPYVSTNGAVSIYGASVGTGTPNANTSYYWFYDWKLSVPGCPSSRVEVIHKALPLPMVTIGSDTSFCQGSTYSYVLDAKNPGAQYLWQDNSIDSTFSATTSGLYWCEVEDLNGCITADTIEIGTFQLPQVSFSNPANLCAQSDSVQLSGGTPAGGHYTGGQVANDKIQPLQTGTDTLIYHFTDNNGCYNFDTAYLMIDTLPLVTASTIADLCVGGSPTTLLFGNPSGGVYSGNNVVNGEYDPVAVTSDTLKYIFMDGNNCSDSVTAPVKVHGLPTVSHAAVADLCQNEGLITLTGANPTGGSYSGKSMVNGQFDASASAARADTVIYTYTDLNNCSNSDSVFITVLDIPTAALTAQGFACDNDAIKSLSGGSPAGGSYDGPGVNAGDFDATVAGVGSHDILYIVTDANNCSDTASEILEVEAAPLFTIQGDTFGCGNTLVELSTDANGMDHLWSNGETSQNFSDQTNGVVKVTVTDLTTQNNCARTDSVTVTYESVCLSIDDALRRTRVSYFPNPTSGYLNYRLEGFEGMDIDVTIFNFRGQEVFHEEWSTATSIQEGQIDLSEVESGFYFIHLNTSRGSVSHRVSVIR